MRRMKIDTRNKVEVVDIGEDMEALRACHNFIAFELAMPTIWRDEKVIISMVVDDNGLAKDLPVNKLGTSLHHMFFVQSVYPIVGNVVLQASNDGGETIDLPQDWIDLVQAIRKVAGLVDRDLETRK